MAPTLPGGGDKSDFSFQHLFADDEAVVGQAGGVVEQPVHGGECSG